MKPSTKTLGLLGMLGAPFLFLEMKASGSANASLTGVYDLLYMIGWMGSITALLRMRAAGTKNWGVAVLYIQLLFLLLANVSNVWAIVQPNSGSIIYRVLDIFWPVSNVWMLVSGITILVNRKLQGWPRYVVLMAGLWLPVMTGCMLLLGKTEASFYIGGGYSVLAWAVMGWAVFTMEKKEEPQFALAV